MGSSTASETTINTSTDSSNTMVTTMTATDGDNTEDSLDINDSTATTSDLFNSSDSTTLDDSKILQPVPVTPKTPATAKQITPPTVKEERKFVFDLVEDKDQKGGVSKKAATSAAKREERKFVFDLEDKQKQERLTVNGEKSVDMLMEEQIEAMKVSPEKKLLLQCCQVVNLIFLELLEIYKRNDLF